MIDPDMDFEMTLRLFLGEKAYHTAGSQTIEKSKRAWIQKVAKKIIKRVDEIDTTFRHKKMLSMEADEFFKNTKTRQLEPWIMVYNLLRLCGRLLGYDFVRGLLLHNPIYHQNNSQYYTSEIMLGGDVMQDYYDKKDLISVRKNIVSQLKVDGLSDFKIALILNTSEYQVKKLRKEL